MSRKIKWISGLDAKDLFFCFFSALLLILPFNNGKLWVLSWFGFVPVFFALNNKSLRQSFILFFITGIVFWSGVIYWLAHVTPAGTIILILYLSLYFALFGLVIRPFTRRPTPYILLFIPSAWVLLEYARGHLMTGFPWALLGYSQYRNLPAIQIADIFGPFGVSFLVMLVNTAIVEIIWSIRSSSWARLKITVGLVILFLLPALGYGYYNIYRGIKTPGYRDAAPVKIAVVQGNILQELKWDGRARDYIINKYLELTGKASKEKPDLMIWPEASLPVVLEDEPEYFERVNTLAEETGIPLLLGAVTSAGGGYYNSAILVFPDPKPFTQYDKLHLVPFGEFIPFRGIFPFLEHIAPIGDINPGNEYTIFKLPPGSKPRAPGFQAGFGVLICFEDLFPELSREFVKRGANFLVNITNDAWYKKTSALEQHFQASVFRAVENRVYLVRSANTGISGFIDPQGRFASLDKFRDGYYVKEVIPGPGKFSPYTRFGDVFVLICGIIFLRSAFSGIAPVVRFLRKGEEC